MLNSLVTVIIPTYNRAHTIVRALDSVFAQSYKNIEVLVIDDGSIDETAALLERYIQDKKIIYIKTENFGVSHARNVGLKEARGEFIAFLDSDDEFLSHKVESQLQKMMFYQCDLSLSNSYKVYDSGVKKRYAKMNGDFLLSKKEIATNQVTVHGSCLLFRNEKGFSYDEKMPTSEDSDFILRKMSHSKALFISEPLVNNYRTLEGNRLSINFKKLISGLLKRRQKILSNDYGLTIEENKDYLTKTDLELGSLLLMNSSPVEGRAYLAGPLRKKKLYLKFRILYLLSFSDLLLTVALAMYKKLYFLGVA